MNEIIKELSLAFARARIKGENFVIIDEKYILIFLPPIGFVRVEVCSKKRKTFRVRVLSR